MLFSKTVFGKHFETDKHIFISKQIVSDKDKLQ